MDELKQANAGINLNYEPYVYRYERMRMQFMANQRLSEGAAKTNDGLEEFKTMEEYMETLFQKYQDNIVLLVSNQR